MTRDEVMTLDGLALRKAVAKAKGWVVERQFCENEEGGADVEVYSLRIGVGYAEHDTSEERVWQRCIAFERDMAAAWVLVEELRDLWTEATKNVNALNQHIPFPKPFHDGAFFEYLHRKADRRWPWALLYLTAADISRAYLIAKGVSV